MSQRKKHRQKHTKGLLPDGRYWMLTVKTVESAINLYSMLIAFQQSEKLLKASALRVVAQWVTYLITHVPHLEDIANDRRGPYRDRVLSPLALELPVHRKHRTLMLFMCQTMYTQMQEPKSRRGWIENQGTEDYELAVRDYQRWIQQLKGEGSLYKAS